MNSALLILAQDSRVPAIRVNPGGADISQGFEGADILWVREETAGLLGSGGKDERVIRSLEPASSNDMLTSDKES